jgi:hypothetical protein
MGSGSLIMGVFGEEQRNTMRYETLELTTFTPAIKATQGETITSKTPKGVLENAYDLNELIGAYVDWE